MTHIAYVSTYDPTTLDGWNLIRKGDTYGSGAIATASYWKAATGSEPSTYTWTISGDKGIFCTAWTGVDTADPINAQNGRGGSASNSTAPSVDPTAEDCMLVVFYGTSSLSAPSAYSPESQTLIGTESYCALTYNQLASGDATGNYVATVDGSFDSAQQVALNVA